MSGFFKKLKKRALVCTAALMAGLLMSHGMTILAHDLGAVIETRADEESPNSVSFATTTVEASSSNLIVVRLVAQGVAGQTVVVSYKTSSGTAIENIDYVGISNSISLTLDGSGMTTYDISVKCKNTSETREKLRVYDSENTYGRYFNLIITDASNASIGGNSVCKCYLPYDYKVEATTGITEPILSREIAYLNDYKQMLSKYHSGDNDISGKETWKTWKEGISFDNETTRRWANVFVNNGFADAYGSYILKSIDDDKLHSTSNIYMLSGNKEFMDRYSRSSDCPGLSLYYEIEPCKKGGYRIDGKAMYYISKGTNPYKKQSELVDLEELHVVKDPKQIYWIQESDAWYSSKNSIYDSMFYKTAPYNGVLDYGFAIFNNNKSWDREVHNIWLFMTLVDQSAPKIVKQYSEYNAEAGTIRVYLRFNEPVYASRQKDLLVKINGYTKNYYASYVGGNYGDTLVYEIPKSEVPSSNITSVTYQLPNDDIGDMAYNLDAYKMVQHNMVEGTDKFRDADITSGNIDLSKPNLAVDLGLSLAPHNVYNIMLSANDGADAGAGFQVGTVYYKWDSQEEITNPTSPSSYPNSHVLTSEEQGSFGLTLVKNESQGISSGSYYLHALAVSPYGFTQAKTFGPYLLDGDAPKAEQLDPLKNDLRKKIYQLKVEKKGVGTSIDSILAAFKYVDDEGKEMTVKLPIVVEGEIPTSLTSIVSRVEQDNSYLYSYASSIDPDDTETTLDSFVTNLMGLSPRLVVDVSFEVEDQAGNKAKSTGLHTIYDKRGTFENTITKPDSYVEDTSIALSATVYDISSASSSDGLTFELADADARSYVDDGAKYKVIVNDEQEFVADQYSVVLKGLSAGYYEAVARVVGTTSTGEVDLISKSYSFYLTNGKDDPTVNKSAAEGNLVLSNRVYQIEDAAYYYFVPSNNSVASHYYGATINESTGKYEGGSSSPTFSSNIEAKKYVKYMEYQDLELKQIDDNIAKLLNSGSGSTVYVKAAKETKNAQAGQLWIRYKKATWGPSIGPSGWAFYYYGQGSESDGININGLSENLSAAIDAVTNTIVSAGAERYLIGEDYTSGVTRAPYLGESQMHVNAETATSSRSGSLYVTNPTYRGDSALYQNSVTIADSQYPIATNLPLRVNSSTILYYKDAVSDTWNLLQVADGTLLKNALSSQATGIYTIREYGEEGVGEFSFYLDRSLPLLNVTVNKDVEKEYELTLDGGIVSLNCTNVAINEMIGEVDPGAYVAVYRYPNRSLVTVLQGSAIGNYLLSSGNYYLEVGDRSGNVVTYTIWLSDSAIEWSITQNDSKTAVIVKTTNRSESEIYAYEVYLNEVLIDTEFAETKIYREPGIYRVDITDIYGNKDSKTFTHEAPSPTLTWYYQNDNGGYSVYDPEKPGKMILTPDPTSSRVTNVLSSAMVRILLGSPYDTNEVQFEVLDTTDYTYSESTGLLSINTLSSWRLCVWYKNDEETAATNEHLYVFRLDTDSPEVSASFSGTPFVPYVVLDEEGNVVTTATFDNLDFTKYEDGDLATLDTLRTETEGQATITFPGNSVISGTHIILTITDPAGIKTVQATRNGQPVVAELSADNKLSLSGYGHFVVTAIDNLGNTTTFAFDNVEGDVSSGLIDGTILENEILTYGNKDIDVTEFYDGVATVLVATPDGSSTYEFHYENGVLTYGQYVVRAEEHETEEGLVIEKYAEYQVVPGFSLDRDSDLVKRGVYYTVVTSSDYSVLAMIDESGNAHYKVAVGEREIHAEISVSVGKGHVSDRYEAILSTEVPTLTLLQGGKEVEKQESLDFIYITNELTIDKASVSENISEILAAYSPNPTFGEKTVVYKDGQWLADFVGTEDGFYEITVTNKYNNKTIYLLNKIESFASVVTVHTLDGSEKTFYQKTENICANSWIELIVMSNEVKFEVNGSEVDFKVEGQTSRLVIMGDGKYSVAVIGSNGIEEDFEFEIKSDADFRFQETWIVGYNEEALLRDQGYTNTLCDIVLADKDPSTPLIDTDIVVIDMDVVVGGEKSYYLLYDAISEEKKTDLSLLQGAIGRYGVGDYTIGFRNKYGDLVQKTVHYNNIPSLVLTRAIQSDPMTYQTFDMDLAVRKGFYSNYILRFSTASTTYRFTIGGEEYRLDEPKVLDLPGNASVGSRSYVVTFLDEYGNYLEFNAILERAEVEFDASAMKLITVGNETYTKDDICITFGEDLKATVSLNGEAAVDYASGDMRYADGQYRFVVRDIAGNIGVFTVTHKSVNHYTLTNSVSGEEVIDGSVVNNASVVFTPSDGSRIKTIVRNGEVVADYTSSTFAQTGHYEILIEDQIGNQSYEEFYILNNSLSVFEYKAPFEFEITEVWYVHSDGSREILDLKGASITLTRDGGYVVVVTSTKTAFTFNFTVEIDNTEPSATLVGVENDGVTARDVTLTGLKSGDVVKIYKDGELISTTTVTLSSNVPAINTGGKYRVTVTNVQGRTIEYNFTRKAVTNVAGSIFIIVSSALVVLGVGIGLTYHTKLKTDD